MENSSHTSRWWRIPLLTLMGLAFVLAAAYVVYTWAPVWFHLPVSVTVNAHAYKVKSGTEINVFLSDTFDLASYRGKLKVDTGQVLDPVGGEPPQIKIDGRALRSHERILRGAAIELIRGQDIVHKTAQKSVALPQKTVLQGKGQLISLKRKGAPGALLQTVDTVTGKVLSSIDATAPIDTLLQAYTTTTVKPKVVALTFDDGPHNGYTQSILAVLQQQKAKATFFELGTNIKKYPALSKACASNGNLVGLHSWNHKDFTKLSADEINTQLQDSQGILKEASGQATRWFRLPYGASNTQIDGQLTTQGLKLAWWTADTSDWKTPGVDAIVNAAVKGARPGAIILMHDGGGDRSQTVAALPKIITALRAQGYSFVTVDELYKMCGGK